MVEDIYDYFENAMSISDVEKAEDYYLKVIRATTRNPRSVKNTIKESFWKNVNRKGYLMLLLTSSSFQL